MSETKYVDLTIVRRKVGGLHLAQSEPRQVVNTDAAVGARGTVTSFAVEPVLTGPMAGTPKPNSEQSETVRVAVVDGVVANPAGANLARLVANGEIFVQTSGNVRLPELRGFKTRAELLAAAI